VEAQLQNKNIHILCNGGRGGGLEVPVVLSLHCDVTALAFILVSPQMYYRKKTFER